MNCFVCNEQEAGLFFSEEYSDKTPKELAKLLVNRIHMSGLHRMVVTMGGQGAVYADREGKCGGVPPVNVDVVDTTGCGDAFFAGVCIGLTYGKTLEEACQIGTRLAASVIATRENVCPRFLPAEFGLPETETGGGKGKKEKGAKLRGWTNKARRRKNAIDQGAQTFKGVQHV